MPKKEIDDFKFVFVSETPKAIKVHEGNHEEAFWLPKSQIEYEIKGDEVEVTMPIWLAREKKVAGY